MSRISFLLFFAFVSIFSYAQDFILTEEVSFGGSNVEDVLGVIQNTDCYVWIANSDSPEGENKTVPNYGLNDYWVVCTDLSYNIQWQKGFGGSSSDDILDVLIDNDGNYYLLGNSASGISGNKTVDSYGSYDYWIIKLDSFGNEIWQNSYGRRSI
ncbi:MAG: hypothetical protein PF448_01215 [Bacteroidales bacterium]|jgi:hypothetical protein|nr:hypothetical protein [Bacteroidales bacterium]